MWDANQMWLAAGIAVILVLVGGVSGWAIGWGRGYDAGEEDALGPASHRKDRQAKGDAAGRHRTSPLPVSELLEPVTEVIDRHSEPPTEVLFAGAADTTYELTRVLAFEDQDDSGDASCGVCGRYPDYNGDPCCAGVAYVSDPVTDSEFTRGQAAQVEAMIRRWDAEGNYDRHTLRARP